MVVNRFLNVATDSHAPSSLKPYWDSATIKLTSFD